jgi:protein TonB
MTSFIHALNIGTLATWLSVAGFGAVGVMAPSWRSEPKVTPLVQAQSGEDTFTLGEASLAEAAVESSPSEAMDTPPPQSPLVTESAPLPDVPSLQAAVAHASPATQLDRLARAVGKGPNPQVAAASREASNAARYAAGRMPKPTYPAQAKRAGQAGTVVIEFSVDTSGGVIIAYAKSSSGWPLLDAEAVRAVRRWTFPAGGAMKLQRPIVFQLR